MAINLRFLRRDKDSLRVYNRWKLIENSSSLV